MTLDILIPNRQLKSTKADRIALTTHMGSFVLHPRHIDCVMIVRPGVLTLEEKGEEQYLGIDDGILLKKGSHVHIACKNAIEGDSLENLKEVVQEHFIALDDRKKHFKTTLARLELEFTRKLTGLQ